MRSPAAARASLTARILSVFERASLLGTLTYREVQVRYKQAFLGAAWAVFLPLALMLVFTALRRGLPGAGDHGVPYAVWSYTGLLAWTMHQTSLKGCTGVLVANKSLLTKVYFPRELFPLSKIGAAVVDYGVGLLVLAGLLVWYGIVPSAAILLLPVVLFVHLLLLAGTGFALSALNVFFRDVQYVFDVVLLVWMFASPVFVDTSRRVVVGGVDLLRDANPMHPILEGYRDVLLHGGLRDPAHFLHGAALSGIVFLVGLSLFARLEPRFAERV
jgi:ABC-type polysaccharide/polyol phosphate export permease